LILQPGKKTNAEIKELLLADQLDYIGDSYMNKLRMQCRPPTPFYPYEHQHHASRNFLIQEGIEDLFDNTKDVQLARSILKAPRAKEFVEAMTLTGAPVRAIALALSRQRAATYTEESIKAFQRYFWNIELLDSTEMRTLLMHRAELPELSQDPEIQAYGKAFKKASFTDPRRVAANLAHSPFAARLAQMRMGFMPNTEELAKMVEQVRMIAVARAWEAAYLGGPMDAKNALDYSVAAEKMGAILEQIVKPDEELRNQLSAIALKTATPKTPSIKQLSGGNHTIDILPGVRSNAKSGNS
jgi:hypothetical protein